MQLAAISGDKEMIELLLEYNADVKLVSARTDTAINAACQGLMKLWHYLWKVEQTLMHWLAHEAVL